MVGSGMTASLYVRPHDWRPLSLYPHSHFDNYSRWITAVVRGRKCSLDRALGIFDDEIAPMIALFPAALMDKIELPPEPLRAWFGDAAPKLTGNIRIQDFFIEALVRADMAVAVTDSGLEFSRRASSFTAKVSVKADAPRVSGDANVLAPAAGELKKTA